MVGGCTQSTLTPLIPRSTAKSTFALNSEIYFSGMWNPYNAAAIFGIYSDTLDVRSRWDLEDVNFTIENFLKE